jgi:hypothetical protein
MSNDEQSIVTTRPQVVNTYPPQEMLEVTLNLWGRTSEAQNMIYTLHSCGSFTPSGAFDIDDRSTRPRYFFMKNDFLPSTEAAGTNCYLAMATKLFERFGELGISTFVDVSQENEDGTVTELP